MPEYIYDDHPEWEGMSPQQLPDWYNKGYASQEDYLLKTTGSPTPTVTAIPNNQLEGLSSQQILPQQQALLTPEQQTIVQNTDQQVAVQNTPAPTPAPQPQQPTTPTQQPTQAVTPRVYDEIIKGFGSPEAYAKAISDKMGAGQQLSNPDAAKQFMADRPDLFQGANQPATIDPNLFPRADGTGAETGATAGTGTEAETGDKTGISKTKDDASEFIRQYGDEITSRLDALEQMMNKPVDITQSPFYQSMMQLAEQNGNIAAQRTMEQLNARGILNSTITAYNVAQAKQQAIVQVMPQILEQAYNLRQDEIDNIMDQVNQYIKLDQEDYDRYLSGEEAKAKKELREYERAWDRSEATGFISNDDAIILGVAPGPTFQYSKWMAEEIYKQQKYVDDLAAEKEKLKLDREKAAETERHNKATEATAAKNAATAASKKSAGSASLTPSGYYSGYPSITPSVEEELGMTKEEIVSGARQDGKSNSQYISDVRDYNSAMDSSAAYKAATDSIVDAMKTDKTYTQWDATEYADSLYKNKLLNKTDYDALIVWIEGSFENWENGARIVGK